MSSTRDRLRTALDMIDEEPERAKRLIWEIFKEMKAPITEVRTVYVSNTEQEEALRLELERTRAKLQSAEFQRNEARAALEEEKAKWEKRFSIRLSDLNAHGRNWILELASRSSDRCQAMHRHMIERMGDDMPLLKPFLHRLSFSQKVVLGHRGFSEYLLLKTLSAKDEAEVRQGGFRFRVEE